MLIRLRDDGPLHRQIYRAIRQGVLDGTLPPGARLPSTRDLAKELGVSRTVTVQAYKRLEAEGYTEGRVGAGTFVRNDLRQELLLSAPREAGTPGQRPPAAEPKLTSWAETVSQADQASPSGEAGGPGRARSDIIDFRYGRADTDAFPFRLWRRLLSRRARSVDVEYQDPAGSSDLREALVGYLARRRGVRTRPENIVLTTGAQQALDLVARVLVEAGDRVVLEDPHYRGARQCLQARGAEIVAVATDGQGMKTERLPNECGDIPVACVTPSHQFPAGGVLPLARRLELLDWASRSSAFVLEDDYDSEFRYDGPPIEAIQGLDGEGRVIYAGTFSKVLFPALRVGYLVLPRELVRAFRGAKWTTDRHSPTLEQNVLADFLDEGHFEAYLHRSRARYARRREALLEALDRCLGERIRVQGTEAGIHVLVWLGDVALAELDSVCRKAEAAGVRVYPVAPSYLAEPPGAGLILGYAALPEERIREGVERLASAISR